MAIENKSPHQTVANYSEIKKYFENLKRIKESTPDVQKWLKTNKKFLLLSGATAKEREDVTAFFWEEKEGFIPSLYPLIVQREIRCSNKSDDKLEKEIYSQAKDEIENILNIQLFKSTYETAKFYSSPVTESGKVITRKKFLLKYYSTKIKSIMKKYRKFDKKYSDIMVNYDIRAEKLSSEQQSYFSDCKNAFKESVKSNYVSRNLLIEYGDKLGKLLKSDSELEGMFFIDFLDVFYPIPKCSILILYDVCKRSDKVWNNLMAEFLKSKSEKNLPDFIIATVKKNEDIEGLHKTFKNLFEMIDLSAAEKTAKTIDNIKRITETKTKEITPFPTPPSSKWSDVMMYLMDIEHFRIKIKKVQREVNYAQMGFKYKTSNKKTKLWSILIKFAMANKSAVKYYEEKEKVEKDIQRLNDVLINYFGIPGNPIKYKRGKKGYEAEFNIYDKSYLQENIDSKAIKATDEEKIDEEIDKDINNH